jgi:hypothetical protein
MLKRDSGLPRKYGGIYREAERKDTGISWIQEEVGCRLQEDDSPCNSGMAQEKLLQKNWDPGNMWTAVYIDCRRNKDDPPCKSGMA